MTEDDEHAHAALQEMTQKGIPANSFKFKGYLFFFTRQLSEGEKQAAKAIIWQNVNPFVPLEVSE